MPDLPPHPDPPPPVDLGPITPPPEPPPPPRVSDPSWDWGPSTFSMVGGNYNVGT